jgi:arginyl-tRNA synthetase
VVRDTLIDAVGAALEAEGVTPPAAIPFERPAQREHGDWSTPIVLAVAKQSGRKPRDLADALVNRLNATPPEHVAAVEVAGPGFVNFRLHDAWLHDVLREVVAAGVDGYASHDVGGGTRVNVEFVSTNPTGPVHAGGGRWAAYGDALCNVLARCGYDPHREFYLNDRGVQMQLFADSLAARKRGDEPPDGGYQGDYIREWAEEMPDDADPLEWGYERVKRDVRETLEDLGVHFDTWFSERSMIASGAIEATLDDLRARGVVFDADGAVWLRTTDYGDDKDRVLVKSDGEPTYVLPDIAYHRDKFARGFDLLIDVWGADHHGYVKRLKAGAQALGHDPGELEIVIGQMVKLVRDGAAVRLSRRAGDIVALSDLLDAVGPDVARLTFLLSSIETHQTVDLGLITSQSMENPVYYVQMAHARIAGIARVAAERAVARVPIAEADLSLLVHERELDVLRSLSELPDVVLVACNERAPHKVTTWVRDLAGRFHGFYHDCYVMGEGVSTELTQARLWLVEAARVGLAIGLQILGARAPESM